ncbi:MAG: DUF167 domain-containing protein [Candidatus Omnitrophica bacterium]|nr:DUF167 domain-containing protein [Candidatus Omnitrophota bacterium]
MRPNLWRQAQSIMILELKVIPGAKKNLYKEEGGLIKVYLAAPPVDGKANEALCRFLAEHFGVRPAKIEIIKGLKSRHKVIKIGDI